MNAISWPPKIVAAGPSGMYGSGPCLAPPYRIQSGTATKTSAGSPTTSQTVFPSA